MAKYTLKYKGEQIDKLLDKVENNIGEQAGSIKMFSNKEDREGYLLCDGSSIYNTAYPELEAKCQSYEIFRICDPTTYGVSHFTGFVGANGVFFVSTGSKILYSTDAANFYPTNISTTSAISRVAYGNGIYVLITGTSGSWTAYASTNLTEWSQTSLNISNNISGFVFGNGMFVFLDYTQATANKNFAYSTDGVNWQYKNKSLNKYVGEIDFLLGYFYIGASEGYTQYITKDLQTFTAVGTQSYYNQIEYDGYAYGYRYINSTPILCRTTDLKNWEEFLTLPIGSKMSINDTGIYIPDGSKLHISKDFQNWEIKSNSLGTFQSLSLHNQVLFDNKIYTCYAYESTNTHSNPYITCYLGGDIKQIVLPTMNDTTNQIYGYIKTTN